MRRYSASHLSKPQIRKSLLDKDGIIHAVETDILVLLAEADLRKMYLDEGFPSMHAWCVGFLHYSRDVACQRIQVARAARDYPVLFAAVEEGRLHLSAVRLLAPHLTTDNVGELISAATHRTCEEIEEMIARRVVRLETLMESAAAVVTAKALEVNGSEASSSTAGAALMVPPYAARHTEPEPLQLAQLPPSLAVARNLERPEPEPSVRVVLSKRAHEKLQYAQTLLSHTQADASMVMERALDDLIIKLEKKKFGATSRPRKPRPSQDPRTIPAHIQRRVWEAAGGQCEIICENGKRCSARKFLEVDHKIPLAQGGKTTLENLRLVCRPHNQLLAERAFGAGFMQRKREEAQAAKRPSHRDDVIAGLRTLGVSAREAAIVVERSGALQQPTLEESMRTALKCLGPRRRPSG